MRLPQLVGREMYIKRNVISIIRHSGPFFGRSYFNGSRNDQFLRASDLVPMVYIYDLMEWNDLAVTANHFAIMANHPAGMEAICVEVFVVRTNQRVAQRPNVTTLYNTLHCLIPIMKKHREGSCIAFSCNSVKYSYPWMASFTASKSAVDSLMRSLANEFSGHGLRFNSLMLASLKTEKEHEAKPHGDFQNFLPPEDVVPVIRFLLSPESYLINGNVISLFRHSESFFRSSYFQRIEK